MPEYERIAQQPTGVTLGKPTESSPESETFQLVTGYREVPHSPWERAASTASPTGVDSDFAHPSHSRSNSSNMIRQPVASFVRSGSARYNQNPNNQNPNNQNLNSNPSRSSAQGAQRNDSHKNPSQGLPDRTDLPTPSEEQQFSSEMTLDLSGYQKPSARGFINQPRGSQSIRNRSGVQRLPYAGVALSTSPGESSTGESSTGESSTEMAYPETIQEHESTETETNVQPVRTLSRPRLESPTNSVPAQQSSHSGPREALRDLPVTTGALQKASQMNERSQEREASRIRYTQRSFINENPNRPGVVKRLPPIHASVQTAFDSESSSRTNVVGVIGGGDMPNQMVSSSFESGEDFYSTDSSVAANVVPASVGMHQNAVGYPSSIPTSTSQVMQMRTAARVSAQLLDGSQMPLSQSPLPVEPPTGWNTIRESLKANLARCDDLLRRGAILSAREEVLIGMRTLFRSIDLRGGTWASEPAMEQALAAFEEEADFYRTGNSSGAVQTTERIVSGHRTQALKRTQLHLVSPDLAAQHYRSYSKQQWLQAARSHPYAADLLYAYGKTLEREADQTANDAVMRRGQAIVCYQAAMDIDPRNADNANQLGYALLQLDRVDEAHIALNHSIQTHPNPAAWNNLVEVYRRKGESEQVAFAQRKINELKPDVPPDMVGVPEVVELDAKTFASISPYPARMQTSSPIEPPAPSSPVQQASATVPAANPATKSSWFGKLFR